MPQHFSIKQTTKTGVPRLFLVISKKQFPKATDRNKIKRRFRAALRGVLKNAKSGYTVFVKKGAFKTPFSEIKKEAIKAIK